MIDRAGHICAICAILLPSSALAAPVLQSADVQIEMISPARCEVTMTMAVEGASTVDHRVDASAVDVLDLEGAERVGELQTIGRTRSLVLRPTGGPYTLRYRADQTEDRAYRCPVWLPAVATDGLSRAVRVNVDLDPSSVAGATIPALTWLGTRGSATLGHVPAFVYVPYTDASATRPWSISQIMDIVAVAAFVGASALWIWRRRR